MKTDLGLAQLSPTLLSIIIIVQYGTVLNFCSFIRYFTNNYLFPYCSKCSRPIMVSNNLVTSRQNENGNLKTNQNVKLGVWAFRNVDKGVLPTSSDRGQSNRFQINSDYLTTEDDNCFSPCC